MALVTGDFLPLSAMANSNAVRMWSYTTTDADVTAADYFDDAVIAGVVQVGDVLLAKDAGGTGLYNITTVDNTPGAPNVVISSGTAIA